MSDATRGSLCSSFLCHAKYLHLADGRTESTQFVLSLHRADLCCFCGHRAWNCRLGACIRQLCAGIWQTRAMDSPTERPELPDGRLKLADGWLDLSSGCRDPSLGDPGFLFPAGMATHSLAWP